MKRKQLKRIPALFALLLLVSMFFSGCSGTAASQTTATAAAAPSASSAATTAAATATATPDTRVVKDGFGNDVTVPFKVERVAPGIGAFAQMTEMLGGKGTIVAAAVSNLSNEFKKVFPDYLQSNPSGKNSSNVEDIIASKAQVVYGPTQVFNDTAVAQLKAAGISVVLIKSFATVEDLQTDLTIIANVLGGDAPAKAKQFNDYFNNNIKYVSDKSASLKDADKVKVLSLTFSAGNYSTINSTDICSVYMKNAGGINVAADYAGVQGSSGTTMNVNAEQIIKWAPDLIITNSKDSQAQILKDTSLATVPAVKNNKVYVVPTGTYLWSVRSGEGALMPLWLAKTMYPDLFKDLDMATKVTDFYKTFYGYTLQSDECTAILNGDIATTTLTK